MTDQAIVPHAEAADPRAVALADFPGRAVSTSMNIGAVAIEQERAIAEVQGQIIIAQRMPRSMAASTAEFLEACRSHDFAATAFYSVPNRGSGPSIRLAEEAARCYGNFQYGHRELSRFDGDAHTPGKSEVEVFAWDVQKNNRSTRQITILHTRDKKIDGKMVAVPLTDQTDIDNRIANVASKQMRGRILALMPKALIAAGVAECKKTLAGGGSMTIAQRVQAMVQAFAPFGVGVALLERHLGHGLDTTNIDELADMSGIYNALREGGKVADYFSDEAEDGGQPADGAAGRITDAAAAKKPATTKAKKVEPPKEEAKPDAGVQGGEGGAPAAETQANTDPAAQQPQEPTQGAAAATTQPEAQQQAQPPAQTAQEPQTGATEQQQVQQPQEPAQTQPQATEQTQVQTQAPTQAQTQPDASAAAAAQPEQKPAETAEGRRPSVF